MAKKNKAFSLKARLPKGLRDIEAAEIRALDAMLGKIRSTYELYGFEPLETPAFEYSDVLGKFLPDQDRPNAGVFSFEDEDDGWVSLRYDLTAPLARYVAQNYDALPKPFRRYQTGPVWRNEKPGLGRFRQFTQFDADTVGTDNIAADGELCMLASDCLEACGIPRGSYRISVNNRKLLDGILQVINIDPQDEANSWRRLTVLRAIDKLDRLGLEGVERLLGTGRKDDSGDYTKGADLEPDQIKTVMGYVTSLADQPNKTLSNLENLVGESELGQEGVSELRQIQFLLESAGFGSDRVVFDPGVVRGLDYYTGPVFEAQLTLETRDDKGRKISFGSVGGGGRYDDLVARFKGTKIPATGFSIGVSRLRSALSLLSQSGSAAGTGPVVILVMDQKYLAAYQNMVRKLRDAGIRSEMYLGTSGMRAQMKYADKRSSPCVVIQGEDEKSEGTVTIKDLVEGSRLSEQIEDNTSWREGRPAQFSVKEEDMIQAVKSVLDRYGS